MALCLLLAAVGVWAGSDRSAADATRVLTWSGEFDQTAISKPTLRVAAFNVHGGKGTDRQLDLGRIADCLRTVRPDFVGLNEVHGDRWGTRLNQAESLAQHLEMAGLFVPTERRFWHPSFGNGLLSRVEPKAVHRLPLPCTQGKKYRAATLTSFTLGEETVNVVCVHLDRVKDREAQLKLVFSLFVDLAEPAILMGDLNTFEDDPLLIRLLNQPGVRDAVGERLGSEDPPRRIDWILTRGLITVEAGCVPNEASDHPLVWAELALPANSAKVIPQSDEN